MMYDDLIKQLRYCADATTCRNCLWKTEWCPTDMQKNAADAIEELRKAVLRLEDESGIYDELPTVFIYPTKWIPVTERLPNDGTLVGKLIVDSEGSIRIASQCAEITLNGGKTVYTDLVDLVDFLAEETPTTEWDDCTHITHWMPLPEPPKGGE